MQVKLKLLFLFMLIVATSSRGQSVVTGADQISSVVSKLQGKRVAMMVNQTSVVGKSHLVDSLKALGIDIKKIFAVEHGFRGSVEAGETVNNSIDSRTSIPIISLYGSAKKPTPENLSDVDIVLFDIQDVGARFYTYISSLHYLMEACAEQGKPLLILDRPNPNGYVDGPMLKKEFKTFVGMHPIPVLHGMTIAEYAQMINGEGWLLDSKKCELVIIPLKSWRHHDAYSLPIRPSPNLTNDQAIALYPSLCFFEGTAISVGRGTEHPFEWIGHPDLKDKYVFQFKPQSIPGMAKQPPLENKVCYGLDLTKVKVKRQLDLSYLINLYKAFPDKEKFFQKFFNNLAGTQQLKQQIISGMSEQEIRASWQADLAAFKKVRGKYLLYP